ITPLTAASFRVSGLDPFTAADGAYLLTVDASAIHDPAGNAGTGSGSTGWTMDATPPTVTIDQAANQPEPTNGPVRFAVAFSEPVVEFDATKVDLSGTTAPGATAGVTDAGDHAHFTVTVSGMTAGGVVAAAIDPGVVTDPAGNPNAGSNPATVTYVRSGTAQF